MSAFEKAFGCVRIALGWVFLWAFADKLVGFGFATTPSKAWIYGNSPTSGFLLNGTSGPFEQFFQNLAGSPIVDWLFMLGLLCIGLTIFLGVMVRIGALFGMVLMMLIYLAAFPPQNNPVVDEHIVYVLIFLSMMFVPVGRWNGFGDRWLNIGFVKRISWLQ